MGSIFGDKGFRQSIGEDKENLQVSSELPKALSVRPEQAEIVTAVASRLLKNGHTNSLFPIFKGNFRYFGDLTASIYRF